MSEAISTNRMPSDRSTAVVSSLGRAIFSLDIIDYDFYDVECICG
jgi:hypothetical protein